MDLKKLIEYKKKHNHIKGINAVVTLGKDGVREPEIGFQTEKYCQKKSKKKHLLLFPNSDKFLKIFFRQPLLIYKILIV